MTRALLALLLGAACAVEPAADHVDVQRISVERFLLGSPSERAAEVQRLRGAFERQGMVVLVDHGVGDEVIDGAFDRSRDFFALPRSRKETFTMLPGLNRSYSAVTAPRGKGYAVQQEDGGAVLNEWLLVRNSSVPLDASDHYYTCSEGREFYSPEALSPPQHAHWPAEVPGLQEATAKYYAAMEQLANTVYELLAVALELPADFFLRRARHSPLWPVTIAHYPAQRRPPTPGKMRIQPHWDRTLFALIATSDAGTDRRGGLQILVNPEGVGVDGRADRKVWRNVRAPAKSFVVNVGEMMARWTNGHFKHVVHRVPNPPVEADEEGRISLMAYVLPDYDTPVDCNDAVCRMTGEAPLYEPTWVGEMMNWGSKLAIYNQTKQEQMRMAQGLYTFEGEQTSLGEPTDVNDVEAVPGAAVGGGRAHIDTIDIGALILDNASAAAQQRTAEALGRAFGRTGFAVVLGGP